MKKLIESWDIGSTATRFWQVFFDAEYSRALYLDAFHFKAYRVLSQDKTSRKLFVSPKLSLPRPIAKLIGDSFAYEQHGTFDSTEGLFTWKMVQPGDVSGKPGIVSSSGTIRVTDTGAGRCQRTDEVTITANVFGLGGLIESSVEKELRDSWATEIAFVRSWITDHPA